MIAFAFFFSLNSVFTKLLYDQHPEVTITEVIFHRSNVTWFFFLCMLNVEAKKLLWDNITRDMLPELISKMF